MPTIKYLSPSEAIPSERHVAVVIHRDHTGREKGYFYDSVENDHGGSAAFDWLMKEAIERAERFAASKKIPLVVIRAAKD